ncbi:type I restriction enzyme S subunit [Dietzia psychralcaliphila]|nr:type I restriction enzyme S subunit [Dietzia psychralcaliphila]
MEREPVAIEPTAEYRKIGILSWGKGLIRYPACAGTEMGSMKYFTFPAPSLIFSNIQAWEGAAALAEPADESRVCSSRFYPYVPRAESLACLDFFGQFFRSTAGHELMRRCSPGTQVRNKLLSRAKLESALVPLPSLADQTRIAEHLHQLGNTSDLDRKGSVVEPLHSLLEHVRTSAPHVPLGEVFELERRTAKIEPGSTATEIGLRSFGKGAFAKTPRDGADIGEKRVFWVEKDDLLISNVFAWEGAVAIAESHHSGLIGSHRFMTWVADSARVNPRFIAAHLTNPNGIKSLAECSPGSAGRNRTLSVKNCANVSIPLPDLATQNRVSELSLQRDRTNALRARRNELAAALLPSARNEIFTAMR